MNSHSHKSSASGSMLTSVAESIGATLGTIAAKAGKVQKALVKPSRSRRSEASRTSHTRKKSRTKRGGSRPAAARASSSRPKATRKRARANSKRA